jgi:hypothetical protein
MKVKINEETIEPALKAVKALRTIREVINDEFGERCPDFEAFCPTCVAWSHFDAVEQAVNHYIDNKMNCEVNK